LRGEEGPPLFFPEFGGGGKGRKQILKRNREERGGRESFELLRGSQNPVAWKRGRCRLQLGDRRRGSMQYLQPSRGGKERPARDVLSAGARSNEVIFSGENICRLILGAMSG